MWKWCHKKIYAIKSVPYNIPLFSFDVQGSSNPWISKQKHQFLIWLGLKRVSYWIFSLRLKCTFLARVKKVCPPWMQIPLGVSHKSGPFGKETRVSLTFPPEQNPIRFSTSHSTWHWHCSKKYSPPYLTTHQLFFWAFTPSSEPPFLLRSCKP